MKTSYKTPEYIREAALAYYRDNRKTVLAAATQERRERGILGRKPAKTAREKLRAVVVCKCGRQVMTPSLLRKSSRVCLRCKRLARPGVSMMNSRQRRASATSGFGKFVAWKKSQVCLSCGRGHSKKYPLDLHHRDPAIKLFKISRGVHSVSAERLWAEVAKCDVLCKPCHTWLHVANTTSVPYPG
jgi:hypothetical protein